MGSRLDTTGGVALPRLTARLSRRDTMPSSSSPTRSSQPASSSSSSSRSDPCREEAEGANQRSTPSYLQAGLDTTQAVLKQGEDRDTEGESSSSPVSSASQGGENMSANTNQLSRTSSRREASLSPPESSSSLSSKEASPSTQASGSSQEAAKQSGSQEAQKPQDIPAEKENVNLLLQKQSSNLSVGGRGTWPESPRWGSGKSGHSRPMGEGLVL